MRTTEENAVSTGGRETSNNAAGWAADNRRCAAMVVLPTGEDLAPAKGGNAAFPVDTSLLHLFERVQTWRQKLAIKFFGKQLVEAPEG